MSRLRNQPKQGVLGMGRRHAAAGLGLAIAVYLVSKIYDALNHGPYALFLRTPLDAAMPLVKVFVVPYVSLNPVTYATLVIFLLFRLRVYESAALSMITAFLVSYAFYFLVQSYVSRPVVYGDDVFSRLLRDVYRGDNPYNDFPSLHVSISTVLAIHWWRFNRRAGWVAAAWAIVVIASTQLVHQHYLADVAGGLLLAFGASWLWGRVLLNPLAGTRAQAPRAPQIGPQLTAPRCGVEMRSRQHQQRQDGEGQHELHGEQGARRHDAEPVTVQEHEGDRDELPRQFQGRPPTLAAIPHPGQRRD